MKGESNHFPLSFLQYLTMWFNKKNRQHFITTLLLVASLSLLGCSNAFSLNRLAKSDVDMVADIHWQTVDNLVKTLMRKLYLRNPNELKKNQGKSIDDMIAILWRQPLDKQTTAYQVNELGTMELAFSPGFRGDRVYALMAGFRGMLSQSYEYQSEFYMLDSLDGQKLYNSARNIEIMAWRLNQKINTSGEPVLLSNNLEEGNVNISFERLFGKLIETQDLLAKIMEDKTQRTINRVTHGVLTMTFIPI